jgi:hypothetical protein
VLADKREYLVQQNIVRWRMFPQYYNGRVHGSQHARSDDLTIVLCGWEVSIFSDEMFDKVSDWEGIFAKL